MIQFRQSTNCIVFHNISNIVIQANIKYEIDEMKSEDIYWKWSFSGQNNIFIELRNKSDVIERKINAKDNIAHLGREERRKDPLREDVGEEAGLGSDISNFKDSSNDFKSSQQIVLMIRTMWQCDDYDGEPVQGVPRHGRGKTGFPQKQPFCSGIRIR